MRKPDFVIGEGSNPYLLRWWIIPRNRFFNIYLHKICRSDDDRALHDHPWWNISIILKGGYWEVKPYAYHADGRAYGHAMPRWRGRGAIVFRRAEAAHRLQLSDGELWDSEPIPCWSLFITGPRVREWGFHCPQGWRHWKDFVSDRPGGNAVRRGCGE
jgi:hypothetical protein